MNKLFLLLISVSMLTGCGAQYHKNAVADDTKNGISAGTVQQEIRVGMSGADVVAALGSPNIVTTDNQRRETWVYDKISTQRVFSGSNYGGGIGGAGVSSNMANGVGVLGLVLGGSTESGASSTSQRTLTIIIKFDESGLVRDFSYRQSSF